MVVSPDPVLKRDTVGFNSKLNSQMELNHCLTLALSIYHGAGSHLMEPEWILDSPYGVERKGVRRELKNPAVLDDVVAAIAGLSIDHYYQIVLTNELSNPLSRVDEEILPEFYLPAVDGVKTIYRNEWSRLKENVGWVNYDVLKKVIGASGSSGESYFFSSFEINKQNMRSTELRAASGERPLEVSSANIPGTRGVRMIYAPGMEISTFLHFSWKGESCALRNYSKNSEVEPLPNRRNRKSDVVEQIAHCIEVPSKPAYTETAFWHKMTKELNTKHLKTG
jgi:hypothetical protein